MENRNFEIGVKSLMISKNEKNKQKNCLKIV